MGSFIEEYRGIDRETWDYYWVIHNNPGFKNVFGEPLTDDSFRNFVSSYFRHGGKGKALKIEGVDPNETRYPGHICSVFFFGILLYSKMNLKLTHNFGKSHRGYEYFPLMWFLIALFHDFAYEIEEKSIKGRIGQKNVTDYVKSNNITHNLFRHKSDPSNPLLKSRFGYFKYRVHQWKKLDHGLVAGLFLYDKLVKIRRKRAKAIAQGTIDSDSRDWHPDLEIQYKMAADAVSCHNIWVPNSHTASAYRKYGMNHLLNFTEIKFQDFPLLYLLGIVDTLEPLKAFNCISDPLIVLENLEIEFYSHEFKISNKAGSPLDFSKLKKQAEYFEGWLAVAVDPNNNDDENCLTLRIKI